MFATWTRGNIAATIWHTSCPGHRGARPGKGPWTGASERCWRCLTGCVAWAHWRRRVAGEVSPRASRASVCRAVLSSSRPATSVVDLGSSLDWHYDFDYDWRCSLPRHLGTTVVLPPGMPPSDSDSASSVAAYARLGGSCSRPDSFGASPRFLRYLLLLCSGTASPACWRSGQR